MSKIHDEDSLKEQLDFTLMKRLLKYAKPYMGHLILTFLLIIVATGSDLLRPYLMKISIDDYISGDLAPMVVMDTLPNTKVKYTVFDDKYYIRTKYLKDMNLDSYNKAQLVKYDGKYGIASQYIPKETAYTLSDSSSKDSYILKIKGEEIKVKSISKEEYLNFRKQDYSSLIKLAILFLAVLLISSVATYIQVILLSFVGEKVIFTLRQELFEHLGKLSLSFYDKNPIGRLVTRVTNDMENIAEMFNSVLVTFFKDFLLLSGTMVIMLCINWKLALVCFSTMPLMIICAFIFRKKSRTANRELKVKLAKINAVLNENIMGMKIIEIFSKEKDIYDEFDKINKDHRKSSMKELKVFAIFRPGMDLIYNLTLSLLIFFGARSVFNSVIDFGVLFVFINYIEQFFSPIFDLSEKLNILQASMASTEKVFQLLDTPIDIVNKDNPITPENILGEIEFKNVWFKYEKDWILKDVSFKINPGETAAFVGATGSGKTTIISLITRLYDIQKGEILLDGINIKDLDISFLRSRIASVLQDVFIFSGNIKNNIALTEPTIDEDEIVESARFVNAHSFIEKLPCKYEEIVRERGATLSAGERQLLSFARALAFKPSILVLDEATSNIDTETEALIQDAISKVVRDRTTIIVAHRLSTIQNADKIIVLHKGVVKEIGNHNELLEKKGLYYNLYLLQYNKKEALA